MRTVFPPQFSLEDLQRLLTIALTPPAEGDADPEPAERSDSWDVPSW